METKRLSLTLAAGMVLALCGFLGTSSKAEAHERFALGVNFGTPIRYVPPVERRWVEGHYELRTETVLVAPECSERQWVPAVYENRCYRPGHYARVLVAAGYYQTVCIPARYETRTVQAWVPGYYVDAPGCYYPRHSSFNLGAFFRF